MIDIFRKLMVLFSRRERRRFWGLMALMLCIGVAELVGVSAVLILLNALAAPDMLLQSPVMAGLYDRGGFTDLTQFQTFVSISVVVAFAVALAVRAGGTYAVIRFAMMRGYSISTRLLGRFLHRPYEWFLQNASSQVHKKVLSEIDQLVNQLVLPSLQLLSSLVSALFIIGFLLRIDPLISALAALLLGGGYGAIFLCFRGRLQRLGQQRGGGQWRPVPHGRRGHRRLQGSQADGA